MRALELLRNEDHERLTCQARYAPCSCGYDNAVEVAAQQDSAEIARLRTELARVREAWEAFINWWNTDGALATCRDVLEPLRTALEGEEGK